MSRTASAMAETICPPHIEGRHPMLYFNIQRTDKFSIAFGNSMQWGKHFEGKQMIWRSITVAICWLSQCGKRHKHHQLKMVNVSSTGSTQTEVVQNNNKLQKRNLKSNLADSKHRQKSRQKYLHLLVNWMFLKVKILRLQTLHRLQELQSSLL